MSILRTEYPIEKFKDKAIVITRDMYIEEKFFSINEKYSPYLSKVVISNGLIRDRIKKVTEEIINEIPKNEEIVFLIMLKGAIESSKIFLENFQEIDNIKGLNLRYTVEYIHTSSYQNDKSTGELNIKSGYSIFNNLKGKNIIIIEDIYDSGLSLNKFIEMLKRFEIKSVKTFVLIQKMNIEHLKYNYFPEYIGFLIPMDFIIGFGCDYNEYFRDLEHLCVINNQGIQHFKI